MMIMMDGNGGVGENIDDDNGWGGVIYFSFCSHFVTSNYMKIYSQTEMVVLVVLCGGGGE